MHLWTLTYCSTVDSSLPRSPRPPFCRRNRRRRWSGCCWPDIRRACCSASRVLATSLARWSIGFSAARSNDIETDLGFRRKLVTRPRKKLVPAIWTVDLAPELGAHHRRSDYSGGGRTAGADVSIPGARNDCESWTLCSFDLDFQQDLASSASWPARVTLAPTHGRRAS
jgi:hypothetical protein